MKHNWLAIIVAVVVAQALGFLWYGVLFQDAWAAGFGIDMTQMDQAAPMPFVIGIVGNLIGAFALSVLIHRTGVTNGSGGLALGLLIGFCFVATSIFTHYAFGQVGTSAAVVDATNAIVSAAAMGFILGAWQKRTE